MDETEQSSGTSSQVIGVEQSLHPLALLGQGGDRGQLLSCTTIRDGKRPLETVCECSRQLALLGNFLGCRPSGLFQGPHLCCRTERRARGASGAGCGCCGTPCLHPTQLDWARPRGRSDTPRQPTEPSSRRLSTRSVSEDEAEDESRLTQSIHNASLEALTWAGEPAYHLCAEPFWLLFSKKILAALQNALARWRPSELETFGMVEAQGRSSLHSRILDTPVTVGQEVMVPLAQLQERLEKLRLEGGAKETRWRLLSARLFTERGLASQRVGADREGALLFVEAAKASGLRYEVTGALGKRTKFQKEEKTILVLAAESQANGEDEKNLDEDKVEKDEQDELEQEEFDEGPSALPNEKGWKSAPDPNAEAGILPSCG
ncbi:hypothetical protein L7F22_018864 [Adiantum nelumboides]|nr:hypothetical protein [Adiantum nelumboides]